MTTPIRRSTRLTTAIPSSPPPTVDAASPIAKRKLTPEEIAKRDAKTWWMNGAVVIFVHIVALAAVLFYRTPKWQTVALTGVMWLLATFGITMGYHRLWSHRAFTASFPLRVALAAMGSLGLQGSIKWWVMRHRLHHRFTDEEDDPYAASKGFWFSHMGWIFDKPRYKKMALIEKADLESDPIVVFQDKYFAELALFSGLALPAIIGLLWDEPLGAYLYACIGHVLIWHVTFSINSFAHLLGEQPFSTETSARGHFTLLALLTQGEAYHNFHHEFPNDYRNGIRTTDWDPTKWLIWGCSKLGLASGLKTIPCDEITQARIEAIKDYKLVDDVSLTLLKPAIAPQDQSTLPTYTREQFTKLSTSSEKTLFLIDDKVVDASDFKYIHPGGDKIVDKYKGLDATKAFYGGVNKHTKHAKRMMEEMVVGKVVG